MAVVAMALVTALTATLGQWQLSRADEKRAQQATLDRAAKAGPLRLDGTRVSAAQVSGRLVQARGRFVADDTIFIDNRTHLGVAGFYVLTPVKLRDSSLHVLVLRGWIARDVRDRNRLPAVITPTDEVLISGLAESALERTIELKAMPEPRPGERLWQNLDPEVYRRWSGLDLQPFIIRQAAGGAPADGLVREWRTAGPDVDKHLGYAVQWFLMSAASAAVTLYLLYLARRHSRKATDRAD
ncbi:MAG TPA: SURF1 family protein [Burkholderiaceae bacterium]|nr:SURF1 family protein [Burkholderiaceae bacterium]